MFIFSLCYLLVRGGMRGQRQLGVFGVGVRGGRG